MPGGPRPDAETASISSKISTASKNPLRALSINNEDHLFNLRTKEEAAIRTNTQLVDRFLEGAEALGEQSMRLVVDNHRRKLNEVWTSYLRDQRDVGIDPRALDADVNTIKTVFAESQRAKARQFVLESKNSAIDSVFRELDARNSRVIYLSDEVRDLVDGKFRHTERKNAELKTRLKEAKSAALAGIAQTEAKFEKLRETHIDTNDREFRFKLNGDPELLRHTLNSALPHLSLRKKKLDERLAALNSKSSQDIQALAREVATLEAQLQFMG